MLPLQAEHTKEAEIILPILRRDTFKGLRKAKSIDLDGVFVQTPDSVVPLKAKLRPPTVNDQGRSISMKNLVLLQRISANFVKNIEDNLPTAIKKYRESLSPLGSYSGGRKSSANVLSETDANRYNSSEQSMSDTEEEWSMRDGSRPVTLAKLSMESGRGSTQTLRVHRTRRLRHMVTNDFGEWARMSQAINKLLDRHESIDTEIKDLERKGISVMNAKQEMLKTKWARPKFLHSPGKLKLLSKLCKQNDG